jgi:PHP family Zn ribbon phosphoesterase
VNAVSYNEIIEQIRKNSFESTIETDQAYGRYHWGGHKDCEFSCSPSKTKELRGVCPKCEKKLVIGVDYRVEELSEIGKENVKADISIFAVTPLQNLKSFIGFFRYMN